MSPYRRPSDRSLAASQAETEPRVALEPPHQLLPHHAGGPEHADLPSLRRHDVLFPLRPPVPGAVHEKTRRLLSLGGFGGPLVCVAVCYGPATAPPPMLVIRIAIIRIAAAGVVWAGLASGGNPIARRRGCQALCIDIYLCMDLDCAFRRRPVRRLSSQ